jgi:hypothetical protein
MKLNEEQLIGLLQILIPKLEILSTKIDVLEDKLDETVGRLETLPCQARPDVVRICKHGV